MNAGTGRVLVIKLGALGDVVQAIGPFAAIRAHHADDRLTLLTTEPFMDFARAGGWFDDIWADRRPRAGRIGDWLALRRRLRGAGFRRVYDLQTSDRSSAYHRLFWPGRWPEWSGIARGCSHPHANPDRDSMHTIERQAEQLCMAGIDHVPPPDLTWAHADTARFALSEPYALLVPGGAPHRPEKRWPAARYRALAQWLGERGTTPVLLGTAAEAPLTGQIADGLAGTRDLAGQTSLLDLAALARTAAVAVGNDTGPMHLTAVAGCPSIVLYAAASDPALCAQRGPAVTIVRRERLNDLEGADVVAALSSVVSQD